MKWQIDVHESPPLIWIRVSGAFTVSKCKAAFDELAETKGSNPFYPILIDDRDADFSELVPSELIDFSGLFLSNQSIFVYGKTAILMNPGADCELAERFEMMTETKFVSFRIFTSEKQALKWIAG